MVVEIGKQRWYVAKVGESQIFERQTFAFVEHRQGDSFCWSKLLKVKDLYLENRTTIVGNGKKNSFWDAAWCTQNPLKRKFIGLFEIREQQNISVREASISHWNLRYRRWLDEDQQYQLVCLRNILLTYPLREGEDKPIWNLNEKKMFTMKIMLS
jgi:hypothetical protein